MNELVNDLFDFKVNMNDKYNDENLDKSIN
jgi:hypothetical protein